MSLSFLFPSSLLPFFSYLRDVSGDAANSNNLIVDMLFFFLCDQMYRYDSKKKGDLICLRKSNKNKAANRLHVKRASLTVVELGWDSIRAEGPRGLDK